MSKERYSLFITVLCLIGSVWVKKDHVIGYVSTGILLVAAFISLIAYFNAKIE